MGNAWEELSKNEDMIVRAFRKCGISVPIDGSEDGDINVKDVDDYVVGSDSDEEFTDEEDPFLSGDEEDSESSSEDSD